MAKSKIVRRPDRAEGGLTKDEEARMAAHTSSWISNALRTDTCDRESITQAVKDLYAVSGLAEPIVVIVPSPRIMAFAGGFASAIWYLRKEGATDSATLSATRSATDSATYSATLSATRSATDSEETLFRQIAIDILGEHAKFGLSCAANWAVPYQGGNMWAAWDCYLTAARDILGLKLPSHRAYEAWERCAKNGGFRWTHEKFCMVCDFPEALRLDEQNRPHFAHGPSHRWRDGWELYYWHGVRVTQQIIMRPDTLTLAQIEDEPNAEVRRVMISRYGTARYIHDSGAELVHELSDTYYVRGLQGAKLYKKSRQNDSDTVMVAVHNSTAEPDGSIKEYMIRVQPDAYEGAASKDCHAAITSTWRNQDGSLYFKTAHAYAPAFES